MTLDEMKACAGEKARNVLFDMANMIDAPEQLKFCGYRTLERYLIDNIKRTTKELCNLYTKYERENPDIEE